MSKSPCAHLRVQGGESPTYRKPPQCSCWTGHAALRVRQTGYAPCCYVIHGHFLVITRRSLMLELDLAHVTEELNVLLNLNGHHLAFCIWWPPLLIWADLMGYIAPIGHQIGPVHLWCTDVSIWRQWTHPDCEARSLLGAFPRSIKNLTTDRYNFAGPIHSWLFHGLIFVGYFFCTVDNK